MKNKKILITAGPTREKIDPVRYISNYSSGKMGYALAWAASQMGAEVTLISGPTSLTPPANVKLINIQSTTQMHKAVKKEFVKNDGLIMAAAPADYQPKKAASQKIKKAGDNLAVELKPTVDILKDINNVKKKHQKVVGFALETENGLVNAKKKLKDKQLDMIILNMTGANQAFEVDRNQVSVIRPKRKVLELPLQSKEQLSLQLLDIIASLW